MRISPPTLLVGLTQALLLVIGACADADPPTGLQPEAAAARRITGSLSPEEALGRAIFFDKSLSLRHDQACASCHAPEYGFTGPVAGVNLAGSVYRGSVRNRSGNRKPPSAAYATPAPILHYDAVDDVWIGGSFWDGRATGERLGNPAADQALGPFLNPVEQALPGAVCVVFRIAMGSYADLWEAAWHEDLRALPFPAGFEAACRSEQPIQLSAALEADVGAAYDRVGLALAAYEGSSEVNAFSSKFDAVMAGMAQFTALEAEGYQLFEGKGQCAACHPSDGPGALFTDYTYDNLGVPPNPLNPIYGAEPDFVDLGLGGFLESAGEPAATAMPLYGAEKVPTLRNVARAPGSSPRAYGHNGVFKSLEQIVHFYNTRDVLRRCDPGEVAPTPAALARMGYLPECWPAPEVAENVNTEELGDLGLSAAEERALVAFLETLSDGWR